MNNFADAQKAYKLAIESSGSATTENERYLTSLSAKLSQLRAEFERLVLGDGGINSFIKETVDAGTAVLKFANSDLGQLSLVIVGLTTLFYTLANAVEKYNQAQALASTGEAVGALSNLTLDGIKTFGLYGLAIGAIVGSIYGLYKAYNYLFPSIEQVNSEIQKSKQAYTDATTEVETLEQKIKDLAKAMSDIRSKDKLEITDQNDLKRMERETAELQIQLSLARQKQAVELAKLNQKVQKANSRRYADKVWSVTSDNTMTGLYDENAGDYWAQVQHRTGSATQMLKEYTAEMRNAQNIIEANNKQIAVYNDQMEHGGITMEEAKSKIQDLNDENEIALGTYNKNAKQVGEYVEVVGELAGTQQAGHEQAQQAIDDYVNMSSTLVTVGDETNGFAVQTQNLTEDLEENGEQADENADKNETLQESLNAVSKAMKPVEKAQKEYAKSGKITSDTIIGIQAKAKKLGLDFTDLMGILSNTDSTAQDVNKAFGSMIQQIVETSGVFDNLTEANADTVESLLEGYGVTNAYTIVQQKLAEQLVNSKLASDDFQVATMKDIAELQSISKTSQIASRELFEYVNAKIRTNQITIKTDGDIKQLIALANAAGATAEKVAQAKSAVATVEKLNSKSEVISRALNPVTSKINTTKKNQQYKDAFNTIEKIKKGTFFDTESALEYKYEPLKPEDFITGATNTASSGGGGGGSKGGGSSSAKNALEEYKKLYKAEHDELEHKLKMDEISETEYYKRLNALNEKYFGEASGHHQDCLDEYRKNQEDIYTWTKNRFKDTVQYQEDLLDRQVDAYQKAQQKMSKALSKQIDALQEDRDDEDEYWEKRIERQEKLKDATLERLKAEQEAVEKEHNSVIDNLKTEIDALKKQKDENKTYWDDKIKALEKTNDELDKQNQLSEKLEALEKAKSIRVKVFKNGRFVYDTDREAVSQAQKSLREYQEKLRQEREKQALQDQRDAEQKNYQDRIDALENYRDQQDKYYDEIEKRLKENYDATEKSYSKIIDALKEKREKAKEEYDEEIKDLQEYQKEQEEKYQQMVDKLNEFKGKYSNALKDMENAQKGFLDSSKAFTYDFSKSIEENMKAFNTWVTGAQQMQQNVSASAQQTKKDYTDISQFSSPGEQYQAWVDAGRPSSSSSSSSGHSSSSSSSSGHNTYGYGPVVTHKYVVHASGVASVDSNELAVVGENPNKEIVVGSKLNNGVLMKLSKDSGVVNSKSTRTFAGLLNSLGDSKNLVEHDTNVNQTFHFGNITLPNVTDGNSFARELSQKFNNYAIQYGNIRK